MKIQHKQALAALIGFILAGAVLPIAIVQCAGGCSSSAVKHAEVAVIDCASAEARTIATGKSVLDVARAVAAAISFASTNGFAATESAIEALIREYGEPIIACAVVNGTAAPASSRAAARSVDAPGSPEATRRALAIAHQWRVK